MDPTPSSSCVWRLSTIFCLSISPWGGAARRRKGLLPGALGETEAFMYDLSFKKSRMPPPIKPSKVYLDGGASGTAGSASPRRALSPSTRPAASPTAGGATGGSSGETRGAAREGTTGGGGRPELLRTAVVECDALRAQACNGFLSCLEWVGEGYCSCTAQAHWCG